MLGEETTIRQETNDWDPRPTLAGRDYWSPEVFAQEQEAFWHGNAWVCVGRSEEIPNPGDYMTRDLAGESIFVNRNLEGEPRAFYNVCSHRGTRFLDEGCGNARKAYKCPYHAWTFDLDGKLLGTPNVREDEHFDRSRYPLHGIAVEEYAGFVFVNLSEDPDGLRSYLDAGSETITAFERFAMQDLRIGRRLRYEVAANWKIIVENYNECLHCPSIHPELVDVIPLFRFGEVWDEAIRDDGNQMIDGATSFTRTGKGTLPGLPGLLDEDMGRYYGTYQFPNLALNLHPDCVMYYILYPDGPEHTTVVSEFLFRPETIARADFDPEPTVEFWDLISRQDWDVCERAQKGVHSRAYTGGVYPRQDRFLFWFNQEYRRALGRPLAP
jgi:Rieske 2Fe-2S family protein